MIEMMTILLRALPTPIQRLITPARMALLVEFLRFGTVGVAGFVADTAVVYALRAPLGLVAAGMASYLVAVTVNWLLNRLWTFRGHSTGAWHVEWARFLVVNLGGFVLNRGAYLILVTASPFCAANPVVAVAAGAVAAMFVNFSLSRKLVFRRAG